jgi:capsular exopolysaccharide synthesis family protein
MSSKKLDERLVCLTAPTSLEAEQYQALRLKLESLHRSRGVRVLAITSPSVKDGKSVTAINLAGALAQGSEARVLLIEADLRRPSVARYLQISEKEAPGLADIVLDPRLTLCDAIVEARPHKFDVVLAGSTAAPIHELFRSPRLEALLQEAGEQYDYVVLDTPPLGPVSDCALLARWIDGVLLVVAAHRTSRKLLEEALNLLDGATVLGIVFNGDDRPFLRYRRHSYRGYFSGARKGHADHTTGTAGM